MPDMKDPSLENSALSPVLIFADEARGLWVFNKPSGWLTHPDGSARPDVITWSSAQAQLPLERPLRGALEATPHAHGSPQAPPQRCAPSSRARPPPAHHLSQRVYQMS